MSKKRMIAALAGLATIGLAQACGGDGGSPVVRAARISVQGADTLVGTVGTALADPLTVLVTDASGAPVPGVDVRFTATGASFDPVEATTGADGTVRTLVHLDTVAGRVHVVATAASLDAPAFVTIRALPAAVASLRLNPAAPRILSVGDTVRMRAAALDRYGNVVPVPVAWRTRDPSIVAVDSVGLARAERKGASAWIVASAERTADSVSVVVPASPCDGLATPAALAVGAVALADQHNRVCVAADRDADYELVAVDTAFSELSDGSFKVVANGIADSGSAPAAAHGNPDLRVSRSAPDDRELAFRRAAATNLSPLVAGARSWQRTRTSAARAALADIPDVGAIVSLNMSPSASCTSTDTRGARVLAVGERAIIVADTANPSGGFTPAEASAFAAQFDTLIDPLDRQLFGDPSDIDGNGRVLIIMTRDVNAISIGDPNGMVLGETNPRDLFPRGGSSGCPASNQAETFAVVAPDSLGTVSGGPVTKSRLAAELPSVLAHEYQHLISLGRRMYVTHAANAFQDLWLGEGLSHIAQEALFYRVSGLGPRENLDGAATHRDSVTAAAFDGGFGIVTRLYYALLSYPDESSPFDYVDTPGMRGAIWSFLRFAADHSRPADGDLWFRIANDREIGTAALRDVFGWSAAQLDSVERDWAVSVFADDAGPATPERFAQPSWNMRRVLPTPAERGAFPVPQSLLDHTLEPHRPLAGSIVVSRFRVDAGEQALVRLLDGFSSPLPSSAPVTFAVVRLR
ncbi:MAG TPA: Ig-like domain-containing protein [Gemmatimonadaceae bacterium]|nr:Ig-like domain-containing protein [Gemmatimonadaceae bacterium]